MASFIVLNFCGFQEYCESFTMNIYNKREITGMYCLNILKLKSQE